MKITLEFNSRNWTDLWFGASENFYHDPDQECRFEFIDGDEITFKTGNMFECETYLDARYLMAYLKATHKCKVGLLWDTAGKPGETDNYIVVCSKKVLKLKNLDVLPSRH